jgi:hypothetical protein
MYDRLQCGEDLELRKQILKEYLEQYVGVINRQSITTQYFMYLIFNTICFSKYDPSQVLQV